MPIGDNFYSEEVQEIMGKSPSWAVRWGGIILFSIFGFIFFGCYFIKYPDTIVSQAEITTYNPPVDLFTREDGLIDTLCVEDGEIVKNGQLIAVLESTANWIDVKFIIEHLKMFSEFKYSEIIHESWIYKNYNLGELQSCYSIFQKGCRDYKHYIDTKHILQEKIFVQEKIKKNTEYFSKLKKQYRYLTKDLNIQLNSFKRDSLLMSKGVISPAVFEASFQNLIQKQNLESGFDATLSSIELQIIHMKQQIVEFSIQEENERSEFERIITQCYQQLVAEIAKWKLSYTLTAPLYGKITFVKYWIDNQYINVGDKLASIIPQNKTEVIARIKVPSTGFGKVKIGQMVNIKLNGYPYMEFGVLKGKITSISAVPEQMQTSDGMSIVYMAEVSFPNGLTTSYKKELPMIQRMDGTAEIITQDIRLINRFVYPIVSLFNNK